MAGICVAQSRKRMHPNFEDQRWILSRMVSMFTKGFRSSRGTIRFPCSSPSFLGYPVATPQANGGWIQGKTHRSVNNTAGSSTSLHLCLPFIFFLFHSRWCHWGNRENSTDVISTPYCHTERNLLRVSHRTLLLLSQASVRCR